MRNIKDSIIRPLLTPILRKLEMNSVVLQLFQELEHKGKIHKKLSLDTMSDCTITAQVNSESGVITFGECFLCYLWSACYYCEITYNEGIRKQLTGDYNINRDLIAQAEEVYTWGKSLHAGYIDYPQEYPLPNDYKQNKNMLMVNICFLYAVEYIVYHEVGHIFLNHKDDGTDLFQKEYDADMFAFQYIQKELLTNPENEKALRLGVLLGLSGLVLYDYTANKDGETHPSSIERTKRYLETLNVETNDELWVIACFLLFAWDKSFSKWIDFSDDGNNFKELFYNTYNSIKQ